MNILFVSAEVSPFAKVGGLADVAGSLPKALRALGHDVRVVMPHYGMLDQWAPSLLADATVHLNERQREEITLSRIAMNDETVYLVGHNSFFRNALTSEQIYSPGIDPYLVFAEAVLKLPRLLNWEPDVVHCNDWQTGLIPVLMREKHAAECERMGTVFTIHNLAYQGEFDRDLLDRIGLPQSLFVPEKLETWGRLNFLKAGCVYSDQVNTVSPRYAREIQTPEFGCALEGLMQHLASEGRLSGILNGIDNEVFDPETDAFLAAHYSAKSPLGKAECKLSLLTELELPATPEVPLVGAVTRISSQKGLDLLARAIPSLVNSPMRFVIQGLGDPSITEQFVALEQQFPEHVRFVARFDEDLAHRIYAGADLFAMPSLFEPCGLGQMIALRYGTVPVVRETGGLADTITDGRNGFVFRDADDEQTAQAFRHAAKVYRQDPQWKRLVRSALAEDHGWNKSAKAYEDLYMLAASKVADNRMMA